MCEMEILKLHFPLRIMSYIITLTINADVGEGLAQVSGNFINSTSWEVSVSSLPFPEIMSQDKTPHFYLGHCCLLLNISKAILIAIPLALSVSFSI